MNKHECEAVAIDSRVFWRIPYFEEHNSGLYNDPGLFEPHLYKVFFLVIICHIYPPFTRKRSASLYFRQDVHTRLGAAIFEVSGPPVIHIKVGVSR